MTAMDEGHALLVRERRLRIQNDINEARNTGRPLDARKILDDLQWLLAATRDPLLPANEPRVWTGDITGVRHWWWRPCSKEWHAKLSWTLSSRDIFVADCYPRPTEPPKDPTLLTTCSKVDW